MVNLSMKFVSRIGHLAFAITTAFALGQGCAATNTNRIPGEPYSAMDVRSSFDSIKYNIKLGKSIQTTSTHPDDTRLKPTETTAPLDSYSANGLKVGLESSFGRDDEIRFKIGADLRYGFCRDGNSITILEERKQNTDVHGSESYAFTKMTQDMLTFTPIIGAEKDVYGVFRIGVEGGFPYTGFDVESGYDRLGQWQPVKKDSWSGFGKRFGINLSVSDSKSIRRLFRGLSFFAGTETFNPKFSGENGTIETNVFSFGYRYRF